MLKQINEIGNDGISGDDEHFESCNEVNDLSNPDDTHIWDGVNSDLRRRLTGNENIDKKKNNQKKGKDIKVVAIGLQKELQLIIIIK